MTAALLYPLLGALAGLLAGLFGVGGGLVVVPALVFVYEAQGFAPAHVTHLAIGTSLAVIVPTAVSSLLAHHRRGAVDPVLLARLVPPVCVGALAGAWLAAQVSAGGLRFFFGLFEIAVALQMLASVHYRPHFGRPGMAASWFAGLVIGGVSALLGIGGGTLTVPFLVWCSVPMVRAVGTSAALGLPIALAGAAGFLFMGLGMPHLPAGSTGFVYWPAWAGVALGAVAFAPLGARLAHALRPVMLKRGFALMLALVGAKMAFF